MPDTGSVALVVNAGSSSLKVAAADTNGVLSRHSVDRLDGSVAGYVAALDVCLAALDVPRGGPSVVGHRIVHGGTRFTAPVVVDVDVISQLRDLIPLAPLHQPPGLAAVEAARLRFPELTHVACFDTAFHATMPEINTRFAIPRPLHDAGVRRYGFHGLSYEYVSAALKRRFPDLAPRRVVVAHLGSGASLCGMVGGRSVATTMGMTPLDGMPMATRPGRIDPGILLHLLRSGLLADGGTDTDHPVDRLDDLLNHQCGLLGLSGISGDVRDLTASVDPAAADALSFFAAAVAREVAGLSSDIGGLDALVFTAGIGEHSVRVRSDVVQRLGWLGIAMNADANDRGDAEFHAVGSSAALLLIPTDEAAVIAAHAFSILTSREKP